eukprot:INCI17568.2.p1 GENE.INCI17568.2~~INCI17568.2.p1  ORF type:complete len:717 (-),score=120.93 INCI17568.2:111-2261(-)
MMSGDWIPLSLPARLRAVAANPNLQIISMGGATEAAIWSNIFEITGGGPDGSDCAPPGWSSIPYGRPLRNQTMYILDEDSMEHCEEDVTGMIYIGGVGVALGYFNDPERTAKQFVVHPRTGERLFRTGDLGRLRAGGLIEIQGREDSQVKLNGFRVELGEIDSVLLDVPQVSAAVTSVVDNRLLAYVVLDKSSIESALTSVDGSLTKESVLTQARQHCICNVPSYMVPAAIMEIESIPLNANGKVDRTQLPPPPSQSPRGRRSPQAESEVERSGAGGTKSLSASLEPLSQVERGVALEFDNVLGSVAANVQATRNVDDSCRRDEDFFDAGGTSLSALQLLLGLKARFNVHVFVADFVQNSTIGLLAAWITNVRAKSGGNVSLKSPSNVGRQNIRVVALTRPSMSSPRVGSKVPLYLIHASGTSALAYKDLAQELKLVEQDKMTNGDSAAIHRGLFVVEDGSLATGDAEFTFRSIDQVAEAYTNIILAHLDDQVDESCSKVDNATQMPREIFLGGWSFGGVVAVEVCRRLQARSGGIKVSVRSVLLFDVPIVLADADAQAIEKSVGVLLPQSPEAIERQLDLDVAVVRQNFESPAHDTIGKNQSSGTASLPVLESMERALQHFRNCSRLLYNHRTPVPSRGPNSVDALRCSAVHFVAGSNSTVVSAQQDLERLFSGGLATICFESATHWSLLRRPSAKTIADHMAKVFLQVEGSVPK